MTATKPDAELMALALRECISQLLPFAEDGDQPAITAAINAGRAALHAHPGPVSREAVAKIVRSAISNSAGVGYGTSYAAKINDGIADKAADAVLSLQQQPEPDEEEEPVAWLGEFFDGNVDATTDKDRANYWRERLNRKVTPLYANPAPAAEVDASDIWEEYLAEARGNGREPSPQGALSFAVDFLQTKGAGR